MERPDPNSKFAGCKDEMRQEFRQKVTLDQMDWLCNNVQEAEWLLDGISADARDDFPGGFGLLKDFVECSREALTYNVEVIDK